MTSHGLWKIFCSCLHGLSCRLPLPYNGGARGRVQRTITAGSSSYLYFGVAIAQYFGSGCRIRHPVSSYSRCRIGVAILQHYHSLPVRGQAGSREEAVSESCKQRSLSTLLCMPGHGYARG